jgi:WD40 repeat protein
VVQVSDSSHKSLKGHEAPILSVTLDPDEEFLVTMSFCILIIDFLLRSYQEYSSSFTIPKHL